jgi:lysophospholipase L1-like esterase
MTDLNLNPINSVAKKSKGVKGKRILKLRHIEHPKIAAIGDSSVFGVGDHGGHLPAVGPGWVGRLAHDLSASKFINFSKNGARAKDIYEYQVNAAVAMHPDIALISIGGNDALRGNFSPEDVSSYVARSILKLHTVNSVVVVLGLPDPIRTAPAPMFIKKVLRRRIIQLNLALEFATLQTGARFISLFEVEKVYERQMWHVDRMHPGPIGHQFIADKVRRTLQLPRRSLAKLPMQVGLSAREQTLWLVTHATRWFLRRSIDLIPMLLIITVQEKFRSITTSGIGIDFKNWKPKVWFENVVDESYQSKIKALVQLRYQAD